ncbi:hypothetical protein KAJ27_24180 [bacterium]|nr:hypothetical protein [bacterium]
MKKTETTTQERRTWSLEKQEQIIKMMETINEKLLTLHINNTRPIFVRMKDVTELFRIKKDSLYKYILPLVTQYKLGGIKVYKTEEIINAIESYEFTTPE